MKRRMKRLAAFGVMLMLVLGGCAENKTEPVIHEQPETEEVPIEAETEEVKEEPEEESIPLSIHIERNQKDYYFEGTEEIYLYLQYCDVTVEGGKNENLKRNIENWSMEQSENLRSQAISYEEDAASNREGTGEFFNSYSLSQNAVTARVDDSVVSLVEDTYYYTGGTHGMFYRDGISFDVKNGKRIRFQEIFSDYENFKTAATERIISQLQENYGEDLFPDYMETVEDMWLEDSEPEWYLDASGIVIILQQYEVGPYFIGNPEIHLPYAEMGQYIKDAYLPGNSDGVASFEKNQEIYLQLEGCKEEVPLMLLYKEQEDIPSCTLWLGEQKQVLDGFMTVTDCYLVRKAGEIYCFIEMDQASDDYLTVIYRLTDGRLEKVDEVYAAIDGGNINTQQIRMEFWVNLLGTYGGVKDYHLNEKQEFVTEDAEFKLYNNKFVLTTLVDLPVVLEETDSILPSGSHIVINTTDNQTYVTFTIQETGQNGMLMVQRDENDYYNISINGMNENECFEILPYAG